MYAAAAGWCLLTALTAAPDEADWRRFRGPDGAALSESAETPTHWSATENVTWKTALPGPGSSCPIVVGDRVFVTCYSGYGVDSEDAGAIEALQRHLVCVDRESGRVIWDKTVPAAQPEDRYQGFINEHGYASSTPVSDGERVYVFFGKSGALAFDLEGKQLWQTEVGKESSRMRWGSAASPVLYKNLVIVNASEESQSIRALDKATGREVWKSEASALELVYVTPALVELPGGRAELVLPVPGEIWGLNADNGKLNWFAEHNVGSPISPSPVVDGDVVYALCGRGGGAVAIKAGGKDDVTDSHILWTNQSGAYIPSPVLKEDHLYWVDDNGVAYCVDAKSGEVVNRRRLDAGGGGGGGRGGRGFYASATIAGDKLYAVSRRSGTFVLSANPELNELAHNSLDDATDFNASAVVSDGALLLRSNQALYCLGESK